MRSRKRTEITLKTRQILVVRSPSSKPTFWCSECVEPSQMITPNEAAVLSDTGTRAIYRLIEDGGLHFVETRDGALLICLNSLMAQWAQASGLKARDD